MSTEASKCARCGGPMEEGFIWSHSLVGDAAFSKADRCGWMAGEDLQFKDVGVWIFKTAVPTNPSRTLSAMRCTSCGLLDLYAR